MKADFHVDYLLIGHVTEDLTPAGPVPGGTAVYSALIAQALGCRTALLTSANTSYDFADILPGIEVKSIPALKTTTFENVYTPEGRQQRLIALAESIKVEDVPQKWQRAPIVHMGPIFNEISAEIIGLFSNSLVGLTPQGWFRRADSDGRVYVDNWPEASEVLPFAAALVLSAEDIPNASVLNRYRQMVPIVVLTQQAEGCTVYFRGEKRKFGVPTVPEVNPTGAGDIFATAYFIRLRQTNGNPWEAAEFANRLASTSIAHDHLIDKIDSVKRLLTKEL